MTSDANINYLQIPSTTYFPLDPPGEMQERLQLAYQTTAEAINKRDVSIYDFPEILNGQIWFGATDTGPKRNAYRKVYYFPVLNNFPATTTQAHDLTNLDALLGTRLYGVATYYNSVGPIFFSAPIPNSGTNSISLHLDATNIIISPMTPAYNGYKAIVVFEYLIGE